MSNKRQVTITITVDDLQQYFECSEQEANRIWDEIDEETDIEEDRQRPEQQDQQKSSCMGLLEWR